MYRVYPVIKTEPICTDYTVSVNGSAADTNTARVSAAPINRRWPGHQRQIEQSEPIQFLSMEADEPLSFEVRPTASFDPKAVKIRPKSLGITPTVTEDGSIRFTLEKPAYFTVEAYGRNRALHLFVDPVSTEKIDRNDENLIYFGAGEHDVGLIEMKSNQTLYIDEGAVVYACIYAKDAENIHICGRGILDNSRNKEQILFEANEENNTAAVKNAKRRHTIQLEYCNKITLDGITIRDSLVYNVRPIACSNFTAKNVKIIGCWRYNSDGIDMHNCVGVHICNCFIRTFDDSICVKGFDCYYEGDVEAAVQAAMYRNGTAYDVFRDVLVERCVIWNDWGKCLEIGAETRAEEISNVTFRDCDLIHLTHAALDVANVDYADVHDVTFDNIRIEADETIPRSFHQKRDDETYVNREPDYMPPTMRAEVSFHHEYSAGGTRRGKNRNITFRNIQLYAKRPPILSLLGYDEAHKTEGIRITDLYWNNEPVRSLDELECHIGDFVSDVRLDSSEDYGEMDKNTVDARGQLKKSAAFLDAPNAKGARVMLVGNSITLHGFRPEVGWYHEWGMAASAPERDYVHLVKDAVRQKDKNAAFCVCQVAEWECNYKEGSTRHVRYEQAREFGADFIVLRFIENCPKQDFDGEIFRRELSALVDFLNSTGNAKIIVTTGFWKHPGDGDLRIFAKERGLPLIELGDLGAMDEMKAIGLFEHRGVANHPGDAGMQAIANRILSVLLPMLDK